MIKLVLPNNNLVGHIDVQWQNLPSLQELNLGANSLNGALPSTLGSLSNLDSLNLSSNELTGTIPASWGGLSSLTKLDLSSNPLSGELPSELGNLTGLTYLNIRDNDLSGSLPETLANLSSLSLLFWFDETYLCIPDTAAFSDWLDSLTFTPVGTNRSCSLCRGPEIPDQPGTYRWDDQCLTLVSLYDATNGLHWYSPTNWLSTNGTICDWAGVDCTIVLGPYGTEHKVFALELPGKNLSGALPDLSAFDFINTLDLSDNAINGPLPESMGSLTRLDDLNLQQNQFSGSIPEAFANLTNLSKLDVSDNGLSGALPQGFTALPLWRLDLSNTSVCIPDTTEMDTWLSTILYVYESGHACVPAITLDMTLTTGACPGSGSLEVIAGTNVKHCYTVTNTGDVSLSLHDLEDSEFGVLLTGLSLELPSNTSYTYILSDIANENAAHTGTWTSYNQGRTNQVDASDSVTVTTIQNSINLDMTVALYGSGCPGSGSLVVPAGTQVEYCYEVTNTGDLTLSVHHLNDSKLGNILNDDTFELAPGASTSVPSGAVTLNDTTISSAFWTAYSAGKTNPVQANDTITVTVTSGGNHIFAHGFEN